MGDRYYAIDQDGQIEFFDTAEEARACAADDMSCCRDEANMHGEWPDDVTRIQWGRLAPSEVCISESTTDESGRECEDHRLASPQPAPGGEGDIRAEAVANVDQRHGHTAEFAPDPAAHRADYDEEEDRLRRAPAAAPESAVRRLHAEWLEAQEGAAPEVGGVVRCDECGAAVTCDPDDTIKLCDECNLLAQGDCP